MCDVYIVCDNIEIVVLTMCNLTISSILQKPNKTPYKVHAYISLRGAEGVKQCTRIFSLHDSVLKCIMNDHNIQDMGAENVYIYISYS